MPEPAIGKANRSFGVNVTPVRSDRIVRRLQSNSPELPYISENAASHSYADRPQCRTGVLLPVKSPTDVSDTPFAGRDKQLTIVLVVEAVVMIGAATPRRDKPTIGRRTIVQ